MVQNKNDGSNDCDITVQGVILIIGKEFAVRKKLSYILVHIFIYIYRYIYLLRGILVT